MQLSNVPLKFYKIFASLASAGNIRTIPVTTADPDAASQSLGWPPSTFTAEGAGGVPPDGRDMNGIDNMLSAWAQWQAAGGVVQYDSTFQAAVGGYPKYALVGSVTTGGTYWQSTVDNNLTNPDMSGAGWVSWPSSGSIPWSAPPPIGNVTPNSGAFNSLSLTGPLYSNSYALLVGSINSETDLQIAGVGFSQAFSGSAPSATMFQKLPSGLIIQGGRFSSSTGANDSVLFPDTFPNNATIAVDVAESGGQPTIFNAGMKTDFSGFNLNTWLWNGSTWTQTGGLGVGYIAIGW